MRIGRAEDGMSVFEVEAGKSTPWPTCAPGGLHQADCLRCAWRSTIPVAADSRAAEEAVALHVQTNCGHYVRVTYQPPPARAEDEAANETAGLGGEGETPAGELLAAVGWWCGRCGDCEFVAEARTRAEAGRLLAQHMGSSRHRAWTLLPHGSWDLLSRREPPASPGTLMGGDT